MRRAAMIALTLALFGCNDTPRAPDEKAWLQALADCRAQTDKSQDTDYILACMGAAGFKPLDTQGTHPTSASASTSSIRPAAGYRSDKTTVTRQHRVGPQGHRYEGVLRGACAGAEECRPIQCHAGS